MRKYYLDDVKSLFTKTPKKRSSKPKHESKFCLTKVRGKVYLQFIVIVLWNVLAVCLV